MDPASQNSYKLSNERNSSGLKSDVRERISNLEKCLNIESDDEDNFDVYVKLKMLEDRLLKVEQKVFGSIRKTSDSTKILAEDECCDLTSTSGLEYVSVF